jgi:hypothetical protein
MCSISSTAVCSMLCEFASVSTLQVRSVQWRLERTNIEVQLSCSVGSVCSNVLAVNALSLAVRELCACGPMLAELLLAVTYSVTPVSALSTAGRACALHACAGLREAFLRILCDAEPIARCRQLQHTALRSDHSAILVLSLEPT